MAPLRITVRVNDRAAVHVFMPRPGAPPVAVRDKEWSEKDHPRAENGEFGSGGAGKKSAGAKSKSAPPAQSGIVKQSGKLTEQQHVDMKDYKEGGYRDLNSYLRGGETRPAVAAEYEKQAKRMDGAIAKSKLAKDTSLYRGIQHPALAANAEKLVGREVDVASFQSTSTDSRVAADFAGKSKGGVVFHITAKAGTPALGMDQFETHGNSGENEVLLGRGGKLKITGVDRSGPIPVIKAEIVGNKAADSASRGSQSRVLDAKPSKNGSRFLIGPKEVEEIFGAALKG